MMHDICMVIEYDIFMQRVKYCIINFDRFLILLWFVFFRLKNIQNIFIIEYKNLSLNNFEKNKKNRCKHWFSFFKFTFKFIVKH